MQHLLSAWPALRFLVQQELNGDYNDDVYATNFFIFYDIFQLVNCSHVSDLIQAVLGGSAVEISPAVQDMWV